MSEHYQAMERPATLEEIAVCRRWDAEEVKRVDRLVREELGRLVGIRGMDASGSQGLEGEIKSAPCPPQRRQSYF